MRESEKGDRCGIDNCRSRNYYLEDGQWFCSNGHVREARLELEADYDGVSQSQRIKSKSIASENTTDDSDFGTAEWTGREGYELFLQSYQLVLRHQVHWLVKSRGMPEELQLIVRDLWWLKLNSIGAKMDTGYASSAESQMSDSQMSDSTFSTYSTGSQIRQRQRKRRRTTKFQTPALVETVSICYLGIMLMRLPVALKDLHDWMLSQEFLYLNAIKVLPEKMRMKLHFKYCRTFKPRVLPNIQRIYYKTHRLFREYQLEHGIQIAPLNHSPLLFRFLQELGLPGELYDATKNLAEALSYDFSFPPPEKVHIRKTEHPDVGLMCLVVIAAKLWYGFDDEERFPESKDDITATFPDWDTWKAHLESVGKDDRSSRPHNWEINLDERELYDMSKKDLDLYMDWYERTWYSGKGTSTQGAAPRQVLDFFEDKKPEKQTAKENEPEELSEQFLRLCKLHTTNLTHIEPKHGDDVLRSGQNYHSYDLSREHKLPPKLEVFMKAAATCVGLPLAAFAKELYIMENKCVAKEKQLQKDEEEEIKQEPVEASSLDEIGSYESDHDDEQLVSTQRTRRLGYNYGSLGEDMDEE